MTRVIVYDPVPASLYHLLSTLSRFVRILLARAVQPSLPSSKVQAFQKLLLEIDYIVARQLYGGCRSPQFRTQSQCVFAKRGSLTTDFRIAEPWMQFGL